MSEYMFTKYTNNHFSIKYRKKKWAVIYVFIKDPQRCFESLCVEGSVLRMHIPVNQVY